MTNIEIATAVLAKASLFDQAFAHPDLGIAVAWAEALQDIDPADALAAVTAHYSQPSPNRIMPGDVLAGVKQLRRKRVLAARNAEVFGNLAELRAIDKAAADRVRDEVLIPALEANTTKFRRTEQAEYAARDVPCSFCRAPVGEPCVVNDKPRDVAHPSRYDDAAKAGAS